MRNIAPAVSSCSVSGTSRRPGTAAAAGLRQAGPASRPDLCSTAPGRARVGFPRVGANRVDRQLPVEGVLSTVEQLHRVEPHHPVRHAPPPPASPPRSSAPPCVSSASSRLLSKLKSYPAPCGFRGAGHRDAGAVVRWAGRGQHPADGGPRADQQGGPQDQEQHRARHAPSLSIHGNVGAAVGNCIIAHRDAVGVPGLADRLLAGARRRAGSS